MIKLATFRLALGMLFGLLTAATIFLGFIFLKNKKEAVSTSFWASHTHQILQTVDKVSSLANDVRMESVSLFSGNGLGPTAAYSEARDSLFSKLDELSVQAGENPNQVLRIDSLRTLLSAMAQFTDSAALPFAYAANSQQGFAEMMSRNKLLSQKINEAVSGIKEEEEREHSERVQANLRSIKALDSAFYGLLAIILMLLAATFISVCGYIRQRAKMEGELKKANDLYAKLFYESPIGLVISCSPNGLILDCNQAFANLVNYRRDELLKQSTQQLGIVPDEAHRNLLHSGQFQNVELQLKPKGKEHVWVSVSTQPVVAKNNACFLAAAIDLTSYHKAEEKMAKALNVEKELNKMMSGFVTLTSHEFRTPLSTILSSSFLIENYTAADNREKISKHVSRISSSVKILTSILDEFLLLSQLEAGTLQAHPEQLNIKALLEEACLNISAFCKPGQNITYTHTGKQEVYTDPMLLANVVNNLVSNAIKFSPDSTNIQVHSEVNGRARVTVKDSGIGIPPQEHKYLFDRFYRASNAGTVQGTGIGLHLVKQYVELLGGTIELESETNKGTEFRIII